MKLARQCLLILILGMFTAAFAQRGKISGYIKDAETGEPIQYANVILRGTEKGDATDVHGRFQIIGIPPGEYTLLVSMMGYKKYESTLTIRDSQDKRLDVELIPTQVKGEEVTVTAQSSEFKRNVETSSINLSMKELEMTPSFIEQDVFRTLQMTPSAQSKNDFSSALIVRGGSPDENLILLDGMEIYNPYHLGGIFSTFNSKAISNVNFIAGGFPAEYGNRNSSVVSITNREGNSEDKLFFENSKAAEYFNVSKINASISLLTTKILTEGPIGKGSWMFSWRRTYFDKLIDMAYSQREDEPIAKYYFKDYQGKIIQDITDEDRLTFTGYFGRDYFNLDSQESAVQIGFDWGNSSYGLQWRHVPNSMFHSKSAIYRTQYDYDLEQTMISTDTLQNDSTVTDEYSIEQNLDISDWTFKQEFTYYPTANHTIKSGFKIKNMSLNLYAGDDENSYLDYNKDVSIYSAFLQEKWEVNPKLSIQPGLRISRYSKHDNYYYGPRLGIKYQPTENSVIKANWGKYNQFLFTQNNEESIINIANIWAVVPEYLDAQQCQHFILGYEQEIMDGIRTKIEGYYKPYDNLIVNNPSNNPGLKGDEFIQGQGEAWGAEFTLKKSIGSFTGWVGYSYSRVKREIDFNNNGEINEEAGEIYYSKYDQPHSFNGVLNYKLNSKHSFGLKVKANTGQPYTPVVGKTFSQSGMGSYRNPYAYSNIRTIPGDKNSARYPPYFRVDISYAYNTVLWNQNLKLKFQVLNCTNHWNTLTYVWQHQSSPSEVHSISMFPIIPSVGVEFEL